MSVDAFVIKWDNLLVMEQKELWVRCHQNPILTRDCVPYPCNSVLNPGATLQESNTILLMRVEDRRGISHITVARSANGVDGWIVENQPLIVPQKTEYPEEEWGVEDPRVVYLDHEDRWAITYTAYSSEGPRVSLAFTRDFKTVERYGCILEVEDKDAALFPCTFNGRWALLHRPTGRSQFPGANIWISFSDDFRHWKDTSLVMEARKGPWWDAGKIGLSTPPLRTEEGWLISYHGVKETCCGLLYRVGLALLDLEDPGKVVRRCREWAMAPCESYERIGDVGNVIFPCGWVQEGGKLRMYYGCADTRIGMAESFTQRLLDLLLSEEDAKGLEL